ncbi:MAG: penicillin-binding protein activator [Calditrichia bacterium]|nr:penicillin-binding protein activator [Calditrichia bacterium]
MKRKNLILNSFILLVCLINSILAQNYSEREKAIFEKNLLLYAHGDYEQAEQNFALVITKLPNSPLLTTNYLMLIKSQYKLGDYTVTIEHGKKFLKKFPKSSYNDDVLYVMGNSYFHLNRYRTAAKNWIHSMESTVDPRMEEKLETLITRVIMYKMNYEDIEVLNTDILPSEDGEMIVNIAWAEKEFKEGKNFVARQRLTESLQKYPDSRFSNKAEKLLASSGHQFSVNERLALLLPLSGFNEDVGKSILEGAKLALDEYNDQHNINLEIAVKDYGQEITKAISAFKDLSQNQNILAVVGPLENDITAACAAISHYEQLPLLSPTATENDLVNYSDYFFQINTPIDIAAESIARYALDSLKISRYATFAPIDDHFIKMVNKFTETVEKSGAQIAAQAWYYPGDQDVYKQFMKIKRIGLKLAFTDSLSRQIPDVLPEELDSLYKEYLALEEEKMQVTKVKIDSADIPIMSIDGVFIPIFKEDLEFIAPQIAYSNIQAQYLGNSDWYNHEQLKKNKNYINGIIFGTDGYLNEESWDYRQFRNEFRTRYKKTPTLYSVIGYDSFKYILQAYNPTNQNMSRNQFLRNLKKLNTYNGIYRTIDLTKKRVNQTLQLLKYNYGQIIPLN